MPRYRFRTGNLLNIALNKARARARGPDRYISALEKDFPRILFAIQSMWGYKELNTYFRKISMDDRGGREGFPPAVWEEIYTLSRLHQEIVPESQF